MWCRLQRFDCILLVFFRQWGWLVMCDLIKHDALLWLVVFQQLWLVYFDPCWSVICSVRASRMSRSYSLILSCIGLPVSPMYTLPHSQGILWTTPSCLAGPTASFGVVYQKTQKQESRATADRQGSKSLSDQQRSKCTNQSCWKTTNHSRASCFTRSPMTSRPHCLKKTSSMQSKRCNLHHTWLHCET